jgi:hypothetical protein
MPADDRVWLHDLQAGASTQPAPRQQNPQPSVGPLQAQARRRILVEHGELVTKGENLSLQGDTVAKTGGEESEKGYQNRVHRGCNHHPTLNRPMIKSLCLLDLDSSCDREKSSSSVALVLRFSYSFFAQV